MTMGRNAKVVAARDVLYVAIAANGTKEVREV